MGRGRSGLKAASGTPSGVTYRDFLKMGDAEKYDLIDMILDDPSIAVPDYLDKSATSKLIYALGLDSKPTVVSDAQLDAMGGAEMFRTVYEQDSMPPPSSLEIVDQITNGDYTQLSGRGGSVYGRALYFGENYVDAAAYGWGMKNATMIRAKANPGAKIVDYRDLNRQMIADEEFHKNFGRKNAGSDAVSIYALAKGIDGWQSDGYTKYTMIVNRGAISVSKKAKSVYARKGSATVEDGYDFAASWRDAEDMN